jgi:hypothetical protein
MSGIPDDRMVSGWEAAAFYHASSCSIGWYFHKLRPIVALGAICG